MLSPERHDGLNPLHSAGERLDSWKEVASFFRREVRTVQLWEKHEGLPVRRQYHQKLGTVYAYRRELEHWWIARSRPDSLPGGTPEELRQPDIPLETSKPPAATHAARAAYHARMTGLHFWEMRGKSALTKALQYFQDAIEIDPLCAEAHAGLADTYVSLSYNHMMPALRAAAHARRAVDTALRLNPRALAVRNANINLLLYCDWNCPAAETCCRESLDSGCMDARTLQLYSTLLNAQGRHQEAIDLALQAYRIESLSDLITSQVSLAYFYAGDYGNALSFVERTLELQPGFLFGHALLGRTQAERGNWEEAVSALTRGLEVATGSPFFKALLAYAYAGRGQAGQACELLHELEASETDDCFPAYDVSAVHAILNHEEEALKNIDRAYSTHDMKVIFFKHDPRFERLRRFSGFQHSALSCS